MVTVGAPKRLGDQQIGLGYRHQQSIARVQRFARKIHLRNQSFELTLALQMNVGGSHPVGPHGIRSGLHGLDPIRAIVAASNSGEADEVWIQRRGVEIIWMHVSAKGVGLPDGQSRAGNRLALEIEDTSRHLDDLALRVPVDSFYDRQITLRGRSQPQWEKGP